MYQKLSIAITLCAAAGGFATAQAQVMCGDVITTHQVLTQDLSCPGFDPALTIQGPGGSLDMRRHTLSCAGSNAGGIDVNGTGAVLKSGTVSDCSIGVVLDGRGNRVLNGMILENNSIDGLDLFGSEHRVSGTTARNNAADGFCIDGDGSSILTGNHATNNGDSGFDTIEGDTYVSNVANGNGAEGFKVRTNNILNSNLARNNDTDGFSIIDNGSRLTRNSAQNNFDDGIDVDSGSLNNKLSQNTAADNGSADLEGNGGFDLEDDNTNCDNNTWTSNRGTRNQTCIK